MPIRFIGNKFSPCLDDIVFILLYCNESLCPLLCNPIRILHCVLYALLFCLLFCQILFPFFIKLIDGRLFGPIELRLDSRLAVHQGMIPRCPAGHLFDL
ncbi:MAG: hypothetical protein BWY57_02424 [Betaproteobacteria bacterium ADurb.Bin341]|nr:MAG: hypothetical protein BWY57_02424 [Betaproteobacteria bacterium ADurb.Bin341]